MFDWINNDVIASIANILVGVIPAGVIAFLVGMKKYSKKVKAYLKLAYEIMDVYEKAIYTINPESPGGKKITRAEAADIGEEVVEVVNAFKEATEK